MSALDQGSLPPVATFIRSTSDFLRTVEIGATRETILLEFKEFVDGWNAPNDELRRRRAQKELCRDVGQFANTQGGVLLIGVGESPDVATGMRVASHIAPLKDIDKITQWIEQAITNFLVPSTLSHDIVPIVTESGPILAVNTQPSVHLVALWDRQDHTIEYIYRTNHGKAWMNPDEAEAHLISNSRAMKLMLEQAISGTGNEKIEIVGPICAVGSTGNIDEGARLFLEDATLAALRDHHIEIKYHHSGYFQTVIVPLAAIRAAWSEGHHTMLLLDRVRIVSRLSKLELLPF